jgi:hypothetical protein
VVGSVLAAGACGVLVWAWKRFWAWWRPAAAGGNDVELALLRQVAALRAEVDSLRVATQAMEKQEAYGRGAAWAVKGLRWRVPSGGVHPGE